MKLRIFAENLWVDGKWEKDSLIIISNGEVEKIIAGKTKDYDYSAVYVAPGVIDNHIHGGDGFDITCPSIEGMESWINSLAENGVCGVMPTPYGSIDEIRLSLKVIKEVALLQKSGKVKGAKILGAHLEGPFLSTLRPGAMQPKDIVAPSVEAYKKIADGYEEIIKEISLAPENDGAEELTEFLADRGIKVLAGHTDCGYDKARDSFNNGVGAICHTFNACRPIEHHMEPGVVAAALTDDRIFCEMISDLVHLHPGIIKLMYHCKGKKKIMIISDAVPTTNMPDGIYSELDPPIYVKDGVSRTLADNLIDGGGCYTSYSARRVVKSGVPFEDVIYMTSVNPAIWLGIEKNEIAVGEKAFISAWDNEMTPLFSVINHKVYKRK